MDYLGSNLLFFFGIRKLGARKCNTFTMQVFPKIDDKNFNQKPKTRLLPLSVRILFGFVLFLGLDLGYFQLNFKICNVFIKLFCITIAMITSAIIITGINEDINSLIWFSLCSIEYIIYIIIILLFSNSFIIYLHTSLDFDNEFNANLLRSLKYNFISCFVIFSLSKFFISFLYCDWDGSQGLSVFAAVIYHFQTFATDIVYIFKINILYLILSRLKFLQVLMKNGIEYPKSDIKTDRSIFFCLVKYKEIADSILQIKPLFDSMVSVLFKSTPTILEELYTYNIGK